MQAEMAQHKDNRESAFLGTETLGLPESFTGEHGTWTSPTSNLERMCAAQDKAGLHDLGNDSLPFICTVEANTDPELTIKES